MSVPVSVSVPVLVSMFVSMCFTVCCVRSLARLFCYVCEWVGFGGWCLAGGHSVLFVRIFLGSTIGLHGSVGGLALRGILRRQRENNHVYTVFSPGEASW